VLHFDDDGDGVQELDEDSKAVLAAFDGVQYVDQHTVAGDATDPVGDGLGRIAYDAGQGLYRAEFLIPTADDARGHDGRKAAASRINFVVFDHLRLADATGNVGFAYGTVGIGTPTSAWPQLPWSAAAVSAHPELPTDLTGLIAFIADHEGGPEVYTFDPATRTVRRVTTMPGLFKDGVSLSPDRSRVAFHGAPTSTAFAQYEIYSVNVDGTGFAQLTDNQILDGHPGWSPDGARIVFASFREGGKAKLVVMTAAGQELAQLTPAGVDDNDPDFLPDGRIVFKTDRFSAVPEVRMAVMDADGGGVRQLTNAPGTSDHDPVSDGVVALFERFTKPTNYATDPAAGFSAWNLVEARIDGTGERTLVANGWVNWLPVFDPSHRYIAHLRGVGYTDVQLVTRDGSPLGRLVPGISRLRYLDWK
jgi:Tol biopolymer transport system component